VSASTQLASGRPAELEIKMQPMQPIEDPPTAVLSPSTSSHRTNDDVVHRFPLDVGQLHSFPPRRRPTALDVGRPHFPSTLGGSTNDDNGSCPAVALLPPSAVTQSQRCQQWHRPHPPPPCLFTTDDEEIKPDPLHKRVVYLFCRHLNE
jgi:hypothetical protein